MDCKRNIEDFILDQEVRQNRLVIKSISKLSEIERHMRVMRKELVKKREEVELIEVAINLESANLSKETIATAILICDLSQEDDLDVERIFMEGQANAAPRTTIREMQKMLRLVYINDNFGPFSEEDQQVYNQHRP